MRSPMLVEVILKRTIQQLYGHLGVPEKQFQKTEAPMYSGSGTFGGLYIVPELTMTQERVLTPKEKELAQRSLMEKLLKKTLGRKYPVNIVKIILDDKASACLGCSNYEQAVSMIEYLTSGENADLFLARVQIPKTPETVPYDQGPITYSPATT